MRRIALALFGATLAAAFAAPRAQGVGGLPAKSAPLAGHDAKESVIHVKCAVVESAYEVLNSTAFEIPANSTFHLADGKGEGAFTWSNKAPLESQRRVRIKPPRATQACTASFEKGETDLYINVLKWDGSGTRATATIYAKNYFVKPPPFIVRFRSSSRCQASSDDTVVDSERVEVPAGGGRPVTVEFPPNKRGLLRAEVDPENAVAESDETNNTAFAPDYYDKCRRE